MSNHTISSHGHKPTPSEFTTDQKLRRLYAAHKAHSRCLNIQIDALRKIGLAAKKNDVETIDFYIDVCKRISRRLPRIERAIERLTAEDIGGE